VAGRLRYVLRVGGEINVGGGGTMTSRARTKVLETAGAEFAETARRYYRLVDADDVEGLLDLFEPEAEYRRPGYDPLVGRDALRRFYSGTRVIRRGRHSVTSVVEDGNVVAIAGDFVGELKDGSTARLRFADFFTFGSGGRFSSRETFFFAPLV
jgi:ketosteroid isomerase-like protein